MKSLRDKNGNLKSLTSLSIGLAGVVLAFGPLYFEPHPWIVVFGVFVGMTLMGFAAFSSKSATLDLRAFTHDPLGWRKAKKSYESPKSDSQSDNSID